MSKNTKDKKQLFVIILLLVVLVTASCLGMYAWARYQTITNGSAQGQVAKWSFKVNGEETKFATINLAETLNFQNVAEGRIAPGTNGAFDLVIDASGTEVSLDYFITIDASERPTNMKFYKDSAKQQPLTINSDEKLVFDGEILLENINTPVTKTIYWDWPYETTTRPTQIVKTSEENEAKIVAELKKVAKLNNVTLEGTETANEIIAKLNTANVKSVDINDAIDTAESGRIVTLPITVVGEQQGVNAEGFKQNGIEVTSDTTKTYSAGDVVELIATFNDDVYGGEGRVAMTSATAPVLKIEFAEDTITTGSNNKLIAKVATTGNVIRLGAVENEKTRTATFAGVEGSKIKYAYTVQEDDNGKMQIVSFTGDVYNKKGSKITVEAKQIADEQKITVENAKKLADVVQVGDIVNYNANVKDGNGNSYTITPSSSETGYSTTTTFSSTDSMTWRVLSVDKQAGKVELMAITSNKIYFRNVAGYNNAPSILNNIAKIYGHGYGAESARSITVEDVNQYTSYDKTTYSNSNVKYGGTKSYAFSSKLTYPFTVEGAKNGATSDVTINSSGTYKVPQTSYYYKISSYKKSGISDSVYSMLTANDYWLASRYCGLDSSNCRLGVRFVDSGSVNGIGMFGSGGSTGYRSWSACSVVSLKSNIRTSGQDSSGVWQLK